MPMLLHYFSLKWYSEHETIDQLGLPIAPLQAESELVLTVKDIWLQRGEKALKARVETEGELGKVGGLLQ